MMPHYDLVVAGDRILIDGELMPAVVAVRDGRIAAVEARDAELPAECRIEAGHQAVVPGFIDLHVHFDNPGVSITNDFAVGTANAVLGGVTTVVDHPFTTPLTVTAAALDQKVVDASAGARVDFGLWGGLTAPHLSELDAMMRRGATGFKAFLPENDMGVVAASEAHLREGLERTRTGGGTVLVHAEDRSAILEIEAQHQRSGARSGYAELAATRDASVEVRAVRGVLDLAEETGGAVHLVHLSVPESVDLVTAARSRGVRASCEVAAHHLLLTADDLLRVGWPALCAPPLRESELVEGMWDRLRDGAIDAVVSDHCPYDPVEKATADRDPFAGPFGIQSIGEFAPLFLDAALARGWDLAGALGLLTRRPAGLFRLPGKGEITVGADADLAFLDLDANWVVDAERQTGEWKWSPYSGRRSRVRVARTLVRGIEAMVDGVLSKPTTGRFLALAGWKA